MIRKNKGVKRPVSDSVAQNTVFRATRGKRKKAIKHRVIEDSDFLTEEELDRLFAAARKHSVRDHAILRVAFCKALRASEVGMLQLADYDSRANTLHVHRLKGSNSGTLPLFTAELAAVRAWLKIRGGRPGPLFLSRHNRAISRRMLDHLMKAYGELAGVPREKRHFHVLKHTRCTHLNDNDVPLKMIQHQVGHRDIRNTDIYTHVSGRAQTAMYDRLKDRW